MCWLKHPRLFILYVDAPTDCIPTEAKYEFYRELSQILLNVCSADVMVFVDFYPRPNYLLVTERYSGGQFSVPNNHTDNGGRRAKVRADRRLFLGYMKFCHNNRYRLAWDILSPS